MKNLQLCELNRFHLPKGIDQISSLVYIDNIVFFIESGTVYACSPNGDYIRPLCQDRICITKLVYIPAIEHVWFGTGTTHVFVDTMTHECKEVEAPCKYLAAAWSPNREHVAVCEEDGKIRCYRNCFHIPTVNINFEEETNEPLDKDLIGVFIEWRDDSQDFCVCYIKDGYKIRVYSITGKIVIKELVVPNMIPCVTWRRGMLICAQKDDGKFHLSIYERNGLLHTAFELDSQVIGIIRIKWNEVSDALAVHILTECGTFLNIYTQVDFKYQLKQQIVSTPENPMVTFSFLRCTKYMISLLVANTRWIVIHKLITVIQTGELLNGAGFHAEIDGRQLRLRSIDGDALAGINEIIEVVETDAPINSVTFHPSFLKCVIVDSYSNIILYEIIESRMRKVGEKLSSNMPYGFTTASFYNLCFVANDKVLTVFLNNVGTHDLYQLSLLNLQMTPVKLDDHIIYLMFVPEYDQLLKLKGNKVLYLDDYPRLNPFNYELQKINYVIVEGELHLITLDVMEQLRVNNNIICNNASSFILHGGYLYVTANLNKLYCVRLSQENMVVLCNNSLSDMSVFTRECEDGSLILAGVPKSKHIVLFHTRGNTESILCRNVAVDQIEECIKAKQWKDVYEYIRVERLDLNLIVDINPVVFLQDIENFINSVESHNLLHLFALSLRDDSVLRTTYKDVNYPNIIDVKDKKKVVCQRILNYIKNDMSKYFKVALLCARAIGGLPACMEILHHIFQSKHPVGNMVLHGIQCLSLYFPPDEIRNASLIKMDIDFVRYVFDKLNVDPKEHERLFEEVGKHEDNPHRQFFIVHDYVENYKDALHYLVTGCMFMQVNHFGYDESNDVDEMVAYAEHHRMFSTLYKYCVKNNFFSPKIIRIYTDKLRYMARPEEAALIFRANSMWREALEIFVNIRWWNDALLVMDHLDIDKTNYLTSLAQSLVQHREYKDAAHLYDVYLHEPELAIDCYISGKLFKEAVHCASKYKKENITETKTKPEYLAHYTSLMKRIEDLLAKFLDFLGRLEDLRANVTPPETTSSETNTDCAESVAGSLQSTSTTRTRSSTSSSRTRKEERKKHDLRKGGTYENIALMQALHTLASEAYGLCPDIRYFCDLLVACETDGFYKAKLLQDALANLINTVNRKLSTIWPRNLNAVNVPVTPELINLRKNLDHLDMKYRYPPEQVMINWKLGILDELVDPACPDEIVF